MLRKASAANCKINTSANGIASTNTTDMARVGSLLDLRSLNTVFHRTAHDRHMTTGNRQTPRSISGAGSLVTLDAAATGVPICQLYQRNGSAGGPLSRHRLQPVHHRRRRTNRPAQFADTANLRPRHHAAAGFTLKTTRNRDRLLRNRRRLRNVGQCRPHRPMRSTSKRSKISAPTRLAMRSTCNRTRSAASTLRPAQFGQGRWRLVAIEAGVRFATVSLGGWDTHSQTFNLS